VFTARGALGAALIAAIVIAARPAAAQVEDEIIDDPMLHKSPASAGSSPAPLPGPEPVPEKPAPPRLWRAVVTLRGATQTSWDDLPGGPKDVFELRARALLSAGQTVSDRFKWELGVRFDALMHTPKEIANAAYQFEARPWESYVDVAAYSRLRFKIGEQIISWGRLDLGSAADVLSPYDLREGPAIDIDALRIPTPSVLATWFPVDAFQLDVAYTPFFTPDLFDVAGTNYAVLGPNAPIGLTPLFAKLKQQLDPSSLVLLSDQLAGVNAPSARPDNGEVGARATWRAGPYDLAVTYGFVRSKLPALQLAPGLAQLLTANGTAAELGAASTVQGELAAGTPLVVARYDRYHQVALDLEGTAGSFTIAGEAGLSPSRTLLARDPATGLPVPASSGLAQTGLKATYVHGESLTVSAEGSVFATTSLPPAGTGGQPLTYFVFGSSRRLVLGLLAAHDAIGRHQLDLALLGTSSGPSLSVIPRYGYKLVEPLIVGLGAAFFGGPRGDLTSIANAQKGLDQVFVFLDWRP
jgi:hypothetical protein